MVSRLCGWAILVFWVIAMSWLISHDVLPAWTAQQPPAVVAKKWVSQFGKNSQFGVFDEFGIRIGGIWTRYVSGQATQREDAIFIERVPLIGPTYLDVKSSFNISGQLDEIDIAVLGQWDPIRIHGERYPKEFAFRVDAGAFKQAFKVDLSRAGTFSEMFRPFDALPVLEVGQSWRMQVFNPIAAVMGMGDRFASVVVRVVGREMLEHDGQFRDCFIVEAPNVKAWVERRSGFVLIQRVTLPVGGTFTVVLEPYDPDAFHKTELRFAAYFQKSRGYNDID